MKKFIKSGAIFAAALLLATGTTVLALTARTHTHDTESSVSFTANGVLIDITGMAYRGSVQFGETYTEVTYTTEVGGKLPKDSLTDWTIGEIELDTSTITARIYLEFTNKGNYPATVEITRPTGFPSGSFSLTGTLNGNTVTAANNKDTVILAENGEDGNSANLSYTITILSYESDIQAQAFNFQTEMQRYYPD